MRDLKRPLIELLAHGPSTGQGLAALLRRHNPDLLKAGEGSVYPALYSMRAAGAVTAEWRDSVDRSRRVYWHPDMPATISSGLDSLEERYE